MSTAPEMSASQLKASFGCMARWGRTYLEGHREPDTAATDLGKAVHAELEAWVKHGKMPTLKIALAGLPYAPAPRTAWVERAISFATDSTRWRGFIDVQYALGDAPLDLDGAYEIVVQDWKTTSDVARALSEAELLEDIQGNLYAYEAFKVQRARRVQGKWVYLPTKGACIPKTTRAHFDRNQVLDFVEGTLDPKAGELQKLYQIRPKWTELPKDTSQCYAWGRQCPGFDECPRPAQHFAMPKGDDSMTNAFQQSILASFPPIPGSVPAAPPLPPSAPPAPPVPEAGFVNPPEAPRVAATSPEHAAQLQGIVPPAPPAPDDLDGLSRDQLKALAVLAGCEPENTRKRDAALRDSIRLHRKSVAAGPGAVCLVPPAEVALPLQGIDPALDAKQTEIDFSTPAGTWATATGEEILADMEEMVLKNRVHGFTLFIDCAPLDGDSVPFAALVAKAGEMIVAAGGPNDYRLFDYGAGPGHLACAVSDLLDQHDGRDIVVESATHEGMACLQTLISKASRVVRSFR